eukprot:gene41853-51874_t
MAEMHSCQCEAHPDAAPAKVKDPVCGMSVDPATAKHRTMFEGKPVFFCSSRCKERFEAEPRKFM